MIPMKGDPCYAYGLVKQWPMLGSPKLDGYRSFKWDTQMMTSSFRPVDNINIHEFFKKIPHGWDGELIVGDPRDPQCFSKTSSMVRSHNVPIDGLRFFVFDNFSVPSLEFIKRLNSVKTSHRLPHVVLKGPDDAFAYELAMLKEGYEGIVIRRPDMPYRNGRSTLTDQAMLKVKRFADAEGVCVDVEEMYHNKNEAKKDAQGYTDRSSKKEGLVPAGVAGSLVLDYKKQIIRVSQGLTDELRKEYWVNRPIGQLVKFKYPPGGKDVSLGGTGIRPPYVYLGLRDWKDQ